MFPNFFDKEKYVLRYENLQLYLRLGLKRKIIHHVLEFIQSQWLKSYAEFNTKKNKKALYKLMNNAVYGKAMENLGNRIDVKLLSNKNNYLKWDIKTKLHVTKIFDNNLVAIVRINT